MLRQNENPRINALGACWKLDPLSLNSTKYDANPPLTTCYLDICMFSSGMLSYCNKELKYRESGRRSFRSALVVSLVHFMIKIRIFPLYAYTYFPSFPSSSYSTLSFLLCPIHSSTSSNFFSFLSLCISRTISLPLLFATSIVDHCSHIRSVLSFASEYLR